MNPHVLLNHAGRALLAGLGFCATWFAAVNADRLLADDADAGSWDYVLRVALPLLVTGGSLAGRVALRSGSGETVSPMSAHFAALGQQIGQLTAEENFAGAQALLAAAKQLVPERRQP